MKSEFYMHKSKFPKELNPDGRLAYTVGSRPVGIQIRQFSMADEPFVGGKGNYGYFGFTEQIEKWVETNTKGHLALGDCRGVKELYGKAQGKTAIICGSSRSILKAKELIPDKGDPAHEDYFVIAINAAGRALGADKVDLLFALDFSARTEWYPQEMRDIPIVMSFNCPDLLGEYFSERYYFASPLKEDQAMREQYGFLDIGSIASYSAAHLAYKMGVTRIIWVGHEFAYTPDEGKIWNHWDEPMTSAWQQKYNVGFADDIFGNPVPCDERLIGNMRIVAAISYMTADQGIEVINATGCGTLGIHQEPEKEGAAAALTMPLEGALERVKNARLESCLAG